jgi:hypothetical protein
MLAISRHWVGLVLVGLLSACASNNDRGRVLFAEGRFIEAAEVFEHSELQLRELEPQEQTRYGLYRGMTLLRLGDLDGAAKWLHYARTAEAKLNRALGNREHTALKQAWILLDRARAQETESPDPLRGALARSTATGSSSAPDVDIPSEKQNVDRAIKDETRSNVPNP